jgi:hypothetical protein
MRIAAPVISRAATAAGRLRWVVPGAANLIDRVRERSRTKPILLAALSSSAVAASDLGAAEPGTLQNAYVGTADWTSENIYRKLGAELPTRHRDNRIWILFHPRYSSDLL